jgi:DNA-binding PadR family transcriptional regulator
MSQSSASAIVELSRSKSRYHDQSLLLNGFVGRDGFTAKEVAFEGLGWIKESYGNAPKRAHDLQQLGYLEQIGQKVCRQSGKEAHSYRITEAGLAHLREAGLAAQAAPMPVRDEPTAPVRDKASRIAGLRESLES